MAKQELSKNQGTALSEAWEMTCFLEESIRPKVEDLEPNATPFLDGLYQTIREVRKRLDFTQVEDEEEDQQEPASEKDEKTAVDASHIREQLGKIEMELILAGDFVNLVRHGVESVFDGLRHVFPDGGDINTCQGVFAGLGHISDRLRAIEGMVVSTRGEIKKAAATA